MLFYRCPAAGRGNAPGPAGGHGPGASARAGLGWAVPGPPLGGAGGAGCWRGAEAEQRSRLGRAGVRAGAGPAGRDSGAPPARGLCAPEGGRTVRERCPRPGSVILTWVIHLQRGAEKDGWDL